MTDLKRPAAGTEPSLGARLSGRGCLCEPAVPAAAATSVQTQAWNALLQEAGSVPLYAAPFGHRSGGRSFPDVEPGLATCAARRLAHRRKKPGSA